MLNKILFMIRKLFYFNLVEPLYIGVRVKISGKARIDKYVELFDGVIILDNVEIGIYNSINSGSRIDSAVIGNYNSIGADCHIGGGNHSLKSITTSQLIHRFPSVNMSLASPWANPPIIGNDVWIAAKSIVFQGVKIGNGAVIGAGSVVTKDVPDYAIVAGNPARIIRYRFTPDIIAYLNETKWWNYTLDNLDDNFLSMLNSGEQWQETEHFEL